MSTNGTPYFYWVPVSNTKAQAILFKGLGWAGVKARFEVDAGYTDESDMRNKAGAIVTRMQKAGMKSK